MGFFGFWDFSSQIEIGSVKEIGNRKNEVDNAKFYKSWLCSKPSFITFMSILLLLSPPILFLPSPSNLSLFSVTLIYSVHCCFNRPLCPGVGIITPLPSRLIGLEPTITSVYYNTWTHKNMDTHANSFLWFYY